MKLRTLLAGWLGLCGLAVAAFAQVNPALYAGLRWRNVGPQRAGRVSAVAGVIGQPGKFYIGLPDSGVWETDNAGVTWRPIFDRVKEVDSIGSLAVASSNPDIIYAGTGDLITGLSLNEGNGVYKSSDGGKTWRQSGLEHTHRIAALLVDPKDPELVLAAAQGDYHFKSADRGVFRSSDGGATWTKVLYRDEETGARDLEWDPANPKIVFATTYLHYNPNPGLHLREENGTGLYKSTDEGLTWTEISGHGLPVLRGRIAAAVAPHTRQQRIFLVGGFGLYRSDDGGANWHQMAVGDRRISGNDYICGVYVDTQNPNTVYVMQTSMYRSTDGGRTFASYKGAPGGDDYHVMWIDPNNAQRMILGVDQGATVSLDHGHTWSPWYNQSTAQVYRIATDNRYPYWIYATMQDSGAVAVASRGDLGEITPFDWYPMPAGEAGSVAPDPLHPNVIYAGGLSSLLVKVTRPLWTYQDVSPGGNGKVYRQFTNPPIAFLPQDPRVMYLGTQYVSATSDGGDHWRDISPDLSRHDGQPPVMPAYGRPSPALSALAPSAAERGIIWAGTNNGLVWLTRDAGAHWREVTPPGTPASAEFNFVIPSHTRPNEAYAEMDNRNVGDYRPHIYRTRDYGRTWTEIVHGLPVGQPEGSFVRVVREDPKVPGLLYAGTENTVYVSFNDGDAWQSLRLNLPTTSYRDLVVHGHDLVAGTYGRGFWILDDMSPLRTLAAPGAAAKIENAAAYLFQPGKAVRAFEDMNADTPFPPEVPHNANPPAGAIFYYWLRSPVAQVELVVRDSAGKVVRRLSSTPDRALVAFAKAPQTVPDYWKQPVRALATSAGMHRFNWDLRAGRPRDAQLSLPMTAIVHNTPPAPEGPMVPPGTYTLTLEVDGRAYSRSLTVVNDPRFGSSPAVLGAVRAQYELERKLVEGMNAASEAGRAIADAGLKASPAQARQLQALAGAGGRGRGGFGFGRGGNTAPSLASVKGALGRELGLLDTPNEAAPTGAQIAEYAQACGQLDTLLARAKQVAPGMKLPGELACGGGR